MLPRLLDGGLWLSQGKPFALQMLTMCVDGACNIMTGSLPSIREA